MTSPLNKHSRRDSGNAIAAVEDAESKLRRTGFTVGEWRVEPRSLSISTDETSRRLDPRQLSVLIALAAVPGEVITRDELLSTVWKDTFVSENSLTQAISRLRRALGDDRSTPRFIETVSKSGYRLVAPIGLQEPPSLEILEAEAETASTDEPLLLEDVPTEAATARRARSWPFVASAVLLLIVTLGLTQLLSREAPRSLPPVASPELTLPGNQFGPRLAPRGDYVAFAWQGPAAEGDWDLWVQPIGGDSPVQLTEHPHDERLPTWSPDGQRLAFMRFSAQEGVCGIYAVQLVGGNEERLADCLHSSRSLAWSPNGKWLAHDGLATLETETRALFLLDLETGQRQQLTEPPPGIPGDVGVRFSPDGSLLAFEREVGPFRHDVAVLSIDDRLVRTLTADPWGQVRGVDWSADGASVLFSSNRTGRFVLWQVPVAGGTPERVPVVDSWVTQPSTSREDARLIYRTFRDTVDLWELSLDEEGSPSGPPTRGMQSSRSERQASWSPNGDAIAFISDRSGTTELWSGKRDGTELMRHTELSGPLPGSPSWSPDGETIIFDAATQGHSDLWTVGRQSRRPERLTEAASEERNGTFSRDGRWIIFTSNRNGGWNLWRIPTAGGAATRLTSDGGFRARESKSSDLLYFARLDEPGIWSTSVLGGLEELVISEIDLSDWGSWEVIEQGIVYVRRRPTGLWFAPFDGSEHSLVHQPVKQLPYLEPVLSLSPDGRSLLFSQIEQGDDEIMSVLLGGG